jgi:predicted alpha/beta-hydrolase family hydrolase
VHGLAFLGFPLHAPGKASDERAKHLFEVRIPMLFLQGDRDDFAGMDLLAPLVGRLGARAMLKVLAGADHSFHVPKRSGRSDDEVRDELLDALAGWMQAVAQE